MSNPSFKAITISKRKEGMTIEEFRKHVLEVHVPLVKKIPGVRKYTQNFVNPGDEAVLYDCITEVWFDSKEAMEQGFATPEAQAAFDDIPLCISDLTTLQVQEHEIPLEA